MSTLLSQLTRELHRRWQLLRAHRDAGYTTETVVVTAMLIALALLVVAILVAKVTSKANSIDLG
jgi:hypothetical protein